MNSLAIGTMSGTSLDGIDIALCHFSESDDKWDYEIVDASGNNIGKVTSGSMAPSLGIPIGMGYVKTQYAKEGSEIYVKVRDKALKAKVVKFPFYKG